jgi:hypothetical protein
MYIFRGSGYALDGRRASESARLWPGVVVVVVGVLFLLLFPI